MSNESVNRFHPARRRSGAAITCIKVILVDDHAILRDGLRTLLDAQGDIRVIGDAANGRDAVRLVKDLLPDVVVMDVTMPELNGIEAAYQITRACPNVKVIMLTMVATLEQVAHAVRSGASGYLLKESAGIDLVKAIRTVFAGHRYLSLEISDLMIAYYLDRGQPVEPSDPLRLLSPRERETLQLVVEGKSSSEIAGLLSLSPKTVDTYRSRLMQKLEIRDVPGLVRFALQHGITPLE